jgi:YidC/Oxa1 family membrane protein insertase
MDIQRLLLVLIFAFSLGLVWDGWQRYQYPEQYIQHGTKNSTDETKIDSAGDLPQPLPEIIGQSAITRQPRPQFEGKTIHIKTDVIEAKIESIGGDISYLALLKHPDAQNRVKPLALFQEGEGTHHYVAQTGLLGTQLPNHNSSFIPDRETYSFSEGANELQVRLKAVEEHATKVTKVITFKKGSYLIDIAHEIENVSNQPVNVSSYYQLLRDSVAPEGGSVFLPTYTGAAVYTDKDKFVKIDFADIEKGKTEYQKQSADGWIGLLQHYFVAAWLPQNGVNREYFTRKLDGDVYSVGVVLPESTIKPGQKITISSSLYAGPAESSLDKIAPGLGLTVDYGWLTVLATPLFWVMSLFHSWTSNWGMAIILLTVLIKLLFFPLSAASYLSMAKMRLVAPKLEKIKQQYEGDREKLSRAMMDLYKTEKINPLGGCLPMLIQIPVFIALYWAILASVEMRYAPFFGWITDLSAPDPYYILPVLMGVSMIIQMRLNPKPPDPMQAKLMQIMPIVFSITFFFFPAGLVLYSIVNNILSIAQQWFITRSTEAQSKGVATKR